MNRVYVDAGHVWSETSAAVYVRRVPDKPGDGPLSGLLVGYALRAHSQWDVRLTLPSRYRVMVRSRVRAMELLGQAAQVSSIRTENGAQRG